MKFFLLKLQSWVTYSTVFKLQIMPVGWWSMMEVTLVHSKGVSLWVFFFLRGWRIQWSIVPEVSEPVVRRHHHGFESPNECSLWFHVKAYSLIHLNSGWTLAIKQTIIGCLCPLGTTKRGLDCFGEVPACPWCRSESTGKAVLVMSGVCCGMGLVACFNFYPLKLHLYCQYFALQNLFGKMSDVLEKIKKWVQIPDIVVSLLP